MLNLLKLPEEDAIAPVYFSLVKYYKMALLQDKKYLDTVSFRYRLFTAIEGDRIMVFVHS